MSRTTRATTNNRCTSDPATWNPHPSNHRIRRIAKIVQSIHSTPFSGNTYIVRAEFRQRSCFRFPCLQVRAASYRSNLLCLDLRHCKLDGICGHLARFPATLCTRLCTKMRRAFRIALPNQEPCSNSDHSHPKAQRGHCALAMRRIRRGSETKDNSQVINRIPVMRPHLLHFFFPLKLYNFQDYPNSLRYANLNFGRSSVG